MNDFKIGVPQAMLYHEFGPFWLDFFRNLAIEVSLSGRTDKQCLNRGTSLAIDESCLPLKVYLGHVDSLLSKQSCTHVFIPRLVQCHRDSYFCAKFAGLPDIVKNTFSLQDEQIICPNMENDSRPERVKAIYEICHALGKPTYRGIQAYHHSLRKWHEKDSTAPGAGNERKIAVIGHSYLVKDEFFCLPITQFFVRRGFSVATAEQVPDSILYAQAKSAAPDIYWQLSAKIAGAANYFCRQQGVCGIILLTSFSCGPDSLVNEYIERQIFKPSGKPTLTVSLDEHTGRAGLLTRLEAFWDLMEWRRSS